MEEIKLGTKIRILQLGEQKPIMTEGDIATICYPDETCGGNTDTLQDESGYYWADFNGQGNKRVYSDGVWCVGTLGRHFEILEENV